MLQQLSYELLPTGQKCESVSTLGPKLKKLPQGYSWDIVFTTPKHNASSDTAVAAAEALRSLVIHKGLGSVGFSNWRKYCNCWGLFSWNKKHSASKRALAWLQSTILPLVCHDKAAPCQQCCDVFLIVFGNKRGVWHKRIHWSVTTLKPQVQVKNIDHVFAMQNSSGKPLLYLTRMTHHVLPPHGNNTPR